MSKRSLDELLVTAQAHQMSVQELEEQRRSFAFGNAHIENPRVTRSIIDDAAKALSRIPKSA